MRSPARRAVVMPQAVIVMVIVAMAAIVPVTAPVVMVMIVAVALHRRVDGSLGHDSFPRFNIEHVKRPPGSAGAGLLCYNVSTVKQPRSATPGRTGGIEAAGSVEDFGKTRRPRSHNRVQQAAFMSIFTSVYPTAVQSNPTRQSVSEGNDNAGDIPIAQITYNKVLESEIATR